MAVDATIAAIFGAAPAGIDLTASTAVPYNIACVVFLLFAVASVVLRFYARIRNSNLWWDDYTIVVGLFFSGLLVGTNAFAGEHAGGTHVWSTTLPQLVLLLKIVYTEPYIYACAVSVSKVSVLLLYRRLFHAGDTSTNRMYWIFFWFATFLACAYPLIMFIVMACACRPISFFWTQYEGATGGTCIDYLAFYVIFGGINLLNDIIILLVPIPRIIKLQLSWRKKVSVVGIMMLGSFVCIASIIRIYFLTQLQHSLDASWWMGPGMAWSSLEPSAAIISACLPTFASLLRTRSRNKTTGASGSGGDGYAIRSGASRGLPLHYGDGTITGSTNKANYVRAWHMPVPSAHNKGGFNDDEVELTHQSLGRSNSDDSAKKGRITVDTEIIVSQEDRRR